MRNHISIISNQVSLEISNVSSVKAKFAAYLYDEENLCVERRWYQNDPKFHFNFIANGKYYFKIFQSSLDGEKKTSWRTDSFVIASALKSEVAETVIANILSGKAVLENLQCLIFEHPTYLSKAFRSVQGAVHTSTAWKERHRLQFIVGLLKIGSDGGLCGGQALFVLSSIIYAAPHEFIGENFLKLQALLDARNDIAYQDLSFLRGVLRYRVGDFFSAESEFQKLLPYADKLKYHQTSCPSYFYRWNPDRHDLSSTTQDRFNLYRTHPNPGEGIVLISCDYGYFVSYYQKTIRNLIEHSQPVHVHLILPAGMDVDSLAPKLGGDEVGVSYEYEDIARSHGKRNKTYYAVSRYLICDRVIGLYKVPVLVSDIDIDFDRPLDYAFTRLGTHEISLYFGSHDLPWLKIMAGFNFFGKATANSDFLRYLQAFLRYCLATGRDGWMLDQTALEVTYRNCGREQLRLIRSTRDLLEYSPRQYDNRARFRATAERAIGALKI